jgi:aldehyde dehydrogenase (NAD+)
MALPAESVFAPSPYTGFENQYMNGVWMPGHSGKARKDINPYSSKVLLDIPLAAQRDVDQAYEAARVAQPPWACMRPHVRSDMLRAVVSILEDRYDEIVTWLVKESGSTRIKAEYEWDLVYGITKEASSLPYRVHGRITPIDDPGKESRVYRQPVGVIGVISPWNFPMYLSQRAVAPALALGNSVVLKPSIDTPVSGGLLLAKIYEEAGLPPGVLNVVVGESAEIGEAFVMHPVARVISFTGSTEVGRQVAAKAAESRIIKRVMLELGGNSPLVVLDDADVDLAVRAAVVGRFLHQGQISMSTNRIIIDEAISNEFEEKFTDYVSRLKCGDPDKRDTVIGPLINQRQLERVMKFIEDACDDCAREVLSGEPMGLVLPPHIFADVKTDMKTASTELFAPVAQIMPVKNEAEALHLANDTEYGLSSAVCSRDRGRALAFALGLEAGITHINDSTVNDRPNVPFGGEKNSGIGRFGGEWVIREFTTEHWVTIQRMPSKYPF